MPQRAGMLQALRDTLGRECPGARFEVWLHPDGGDARADFPALIARSLDRAWILQIEDDVWLAPRFGDQALTALRDGADRGASAITLFSRSKKDLDMLRLGAQWRRQSPKSFCMMQAVFLRADAMTGFREWAPSWYDERPQHFHAADLLLGAWLSKQRASMLVRVPSLVQHRMSPSTLPNHRGFRRSPSYAAAFGVAP